MAVFVEQQGSLRAKGICKRVRNRFGGENGGGGGRDGVKVRPRINLSDLVDDEPLVARNLCPVTGEVPPVNGLVEVMTDSGQMMSVVYQGGAIVAASCG